jgi:hypothetical protein
MLSEAPRTRTDSRFHVRDHDNILPFIDCSHDQNLPALIPYSASSIRSGDLKQLHVKGGFLDIHIYLRSATYSRGRKHMARVCFGKRPTVFREEVLGPY